MGIRIARVSALLTIAVLAATGVAGCSSSTSCADGRTGSNCAAPATTAAATPSATSAATSSPATGTGTGVIAPIIINFNDGTAQFATVGLNNVLVINVGNADVTTFTGDVGEPSVAKFVPGHVDGSATFNPGIQPLAVGATTVTITDTTTSRFVILDLTVTK